jgi:hypothetical protein
MDGARSSEIERLKSEYLESRKNDRRLNAGLDSKTPAIEQQLEEALAAGVETVETFEFKSIGSHAFDDLLAEFPPSEEELKDNPGLSFSPSSFGPALVAASCVSHDITREEAFGLYDDPEWSAVELAEVVQAALAANQRISEIPFSVSGTGETTSSD